MDFESSVFGVSDASRKAAEDPRCASESDEASQASQSALEDSASQASGEMEVADTPTISKKSKVAAQKAAAALVSIKTSKKSKIPTKETTSVRGEIKSKRLARFEQDETAIRRYRRKLETERERSMFDHKMDLVAVRRFRMLGFSATTAKPGIQKKTQFAVARHMAYIIKKGTVEDIFMGA